LYENYFFIQSLITFTQRNIKRSIHILNKGICLDQSLHINNIKLIKMKKIKIVLFALAFLGMFNFIQAQTFLPGTYKFSNKKVVHITLNDGTVLDGKIKNIDRKKGLIKSIKIKDLNGNKHKLMAGDIKHMYLAPSGWDNMNKKLSFMTDATKWDNDNYKKGLFEDGYVYFEQTEVAIGKKTRVLLMQLLNPSFSSKIKVYMDPWASETASIKIGGIKAVGGDAKSYYIKKGDDLAFKLKKKEFKKEFATIFSGCEQLQNRELKPNWRKFDSDIFEYNSCN